MVVVLELTLRWADISGRCADVKQLTVAIITLAERIAGGNREAENMWWRSCLAGALEDEHEAR